MKKKDGFIFSPPTFKFQRLGKCPKNYNALKPKNTFINMQTVQEVMGNDIQPKIMNLSGTSCDLGEAS